MKTLVNWLDDRTGVVSAINAFLFTYIPGGPRWRYSWGTVLLFAFCVQAITGVFLMTAYSPSVDSAWASVHHINFNMTGGQWLRGIHHYTASAVVALLAVHVVQVIIYGAYRAPREVTFWLGLVLLQITLAMSLTGYLLPWDQRGYRATQVSTNLAGITPGLGPYIKKVAVGGDAYGNATLTRFYALHVAILPAILVFFLALHLTMIRRHGVTTPEKARSSRGAYYWPHQFLRDAGLCGAVIGAVLLTVWWEGGAELGPPAQPNVAFEAARPEWYFLFLFQTLKYCHGEVGELIGAHVIPGTIMTIFALMPITGRWKIGHYFNVGFTVCLGIAIATLTGLALYEDANKPSYQQALKWAEEEAHVYIDVAKKNGVPPEGIFAMVAKEAKIQGPNLFEANCATCHRINGHNGKYSTTDEAAFAFDLGGFASREYLTEMLDPKTAASPRFFGSWTYEENGKRVVEQGAMLEHIQTTIAGYYDDARKVKTDANGQVEKNEKGEVVYAETEEEWAKRKETNLTRRTQLQLAINALSAEARLPHQAAIEAKEKAQIELGQQLLMDSSLGLECGDCHTFRGGGTEGAGAPDLTGYGSPEWLREVTKNPKSDRFYAHRYSEEDSKLTLMPAFGEWEEALTDEQIDLLVEWMRKKPFDPAAPAVAAHGGDEPSVPEAASTGDAPVVEEPAPAATPDATAAATGATPAGAR